MFFVDETGLFLLDPVSGDLVLRRSISREDLGRSFYQLGVYVSILGHAFRDWAFSIDIFETYFSTFSSLCSAELPDKSNFCLQLKQGRMCPKKAQHSQNPENCNVKTRCRSMMLSCGSLPLFLHQWARNLLEGIQLADESQSENRTRTTTNKNPPFYYTLCFFNQ